jgi:hypothetical protein
MGLFEYREESGWTELLAAATMDAAIEQAEDLARHGDWGQDAEDFTGILVTGEVTLLMNDEVLDSRPIEVQILPEEPRCLEDEEHDWRPDPRHGCDQNPGVWNLGGTTIKTTRFCMHCGLKRDEVRHGPQRNPGQSDSIEYSEIDGDYFRELRELHGI